MTLVFQSLLQVLRETGFDEPEAPSAAVAHNQNQNSEAPGPSEPRAPPAPPEGSRVQHDCLLIRSATGVVVEEIKHKHTSNVLSFVASNIRDAAAAIGVFEWSDTWHGQQELVISPRLHQNQDSQHRKIQYSWTSR